MEYTNQEIRQLLQDERKVVEEDYILKNPPDKKIIARRCANVYFENKDEESQEGLYNAILNVNLHT